MFKEKEVNKFSALSVIANNLETESIVEQVGEDGVTNIAEATQTTPSWKTSKWRRKFLPFVESINLLALLLLGVLLWAISFFILGKTLLPGGDLFGLASLTLVAYLAGRLVTLARLPGLIGMLLIGILFQNLGIVTLEGANASVVSRLRKFALVIILTRAGLGMDPTAFRRLHGRILSLGLIPWAIEWLVVTVLAYYFFGLPWMWSLLLGSMIAAVSPAVIVPSLFRLRAQGYGVAKGIPTLIVAAAGIDDATSVAVFGILSSVMFSSDSLGFQIAQVPVSVIGGVGFGILWGLLAKHVPNVNDPHMPVLRVLLLLAGGSVAVLGSSWLGFEGVGPLAVVSASYLSSSHWSDQGWRTDSNPVVDSFAALWVLFEPILFGFAGALVKFNELDSQTLLLGLALLAISVFARVMSAWLVVLRGELNVREQVFVALGWMAKATVQAALGPVALNSLPADAGAEEISYGHVVLTVCVLSIIVTAPLGAIVITLTGPRLLTQNGVDRPASGISTVATQPRIQNCTTVENDIC